MPENDNLTTGGLPGHWVDHRREATPCTVLSTFCISRLPAMRRERRHGGADTVVMLRRRQERSTMRGGNGYPRKSTESLGEPHSHQRPGTKHCNALAFAMTRASCFSTHANSSPAFRSRSCFRFGPYFSRFRRLQLRMVRPHQDSCAVCRLDRRGYQDVNGLVRVPISR